MANKKSKVQSLKASKCHRKSKFSKYPKKGKGSRAKPARKWSARAQNPENYTSYKADQKDWSWDNLPDILYQLKPMEADDQKASEKPPPPRGRKIDGRLLRDFDVLPDRISSNVEEFRVEAWMRLDRRIQLHDITDRMQKGFNVKTNALQQRNVRFRKDFNLIAWGSGNKASLHLEDIVIAKMKANGIGPSGNSTRGLTPGLIHPELGEAGGRVPLPDDWRTGKRGHHGFVAQPDIKDDSECDEEDVRTFRSDFVDEDDNLLIDDRVAAQPPLIPREASPTPSEELSLPTDFFTSEFFSTTVEFPLLCKESDEDIFGLFEETSVEASGAASPIRIKNHSPFKRSRPFCDPDCTCGKIPSTSGVEDAFGIIVPPKLTPQSISHRPPSFGFEPINFPIRYRAESNEALRRTLNRMILNECHTGHRFAFEMPHVPGSI